MPRLPAALCLASLLAHPRAQVPEGWVIATNLSDPVGVYVASPRNLAPAVPLTNVPSELTLTAASTGANAVALAADGRVAAGNLAARPGDPVVLHLLTLQGVNVVATQRFVVGTAAIAGAAIHQIVALADGSLLCAVAGVAQGGPTNGPGVAVIDPPANAVVDLGIPGSWNALALSPDGAVLYLGQWTSPTLGRIFRHPPTAGAPTLLATTPSGVTGLATRSTGEIVVSMNLATAGLATVDPATGTLRPIPATPPNLNAVAVEAATDNVFYLSTPNTGFPTDLLLIDAVATTTVASYPSGTPSGIAVQNSPRVYGVETAGNNRYLWIDRANPGGIPFLGNGSFSLTLTSSPGTAVFSAVFLSPARNVRQLVGPGYSLGLLVDPVGATTVPIASAPSVTIAAPVPNVAALAGAVLHGQSLHIEASGFAASAGITFGVVTR